ncbi:MAG: hypothetical protein CMM46_18910 [Rhodospirillaceae bacterium]|nr:hypothetical protein [Rhodospirillaceae bacterium]|tara:strand:+ start:28372 stop:29157 length:786 start_codon:yes stop_codon:yes gene_type:complete
MDAMTMRKTFVALASATTVAVGAFTSAGAAELLAHRAVYEMSLGENDQQTGLLDVRGGLLLEVEDRCETWTVRQKLAMQVTRDDGVFSTTSTFDSYEAKDGTWYRFDDETFHEPGRHEVSSGEATVADETRSGRIAIEDPEPSRHNMPDEAMFPMVHMVDLLERAADGERFMSHIVFDGTEGAVVYDITTLVGQPVESNGMNAWPMHLAFFEHEGTEDQPTVEISVLLRDDGVAEEITYDYGDFSIELAMLEFEEIAGSGC